MALAMALLTGCASTATRIDATRLSEVRKGQTTVAEIVNKFGRPNVLSRNWDGTQTAAYAAGSERSESASSLPLLSVLAGGGGSDAVIFYFDTRGVLTDYRVPQIASAAPAQTDLPASARPGSGGVAPSAGGACGAGGAMAAPRPAPAAAPPARRSSDGLPFWLPSDKDPRQQ